MDIITITSINPELDEIRSIRKCLRDMKQSNSQDIFLIGYLKERKAEIEKKNPTY